MIKATSISSFHWKTLVPFCLRKKRPERTLLILTVKLLQNRTEKQNITIKKTVNCLFNDM